MPHSRLAIRLGFVEHESVEQKRGTLEAELAQDLRKFLFLLRQIHLFSKVLYSRK